MSYRRAMWVDRQRIVDASHDETWAVFGCWRLAPVLFAEVSARETGRFLRGLAEKECAFPDGRRRKPSLSTLRRKLKLIRHVDTPKAAAFFLRKVPRTVHRQFADVQIDGLFFRVDPRLRGDKVEVRYDPFASPDQVFLDSRDGQYLGVGVRYDRELGAHGPMPAPPPPAKPQHDYLKLLIDQHDEPLLREAVRRAEPKTVPVIVFHLQQLAQSRRR